MSVFPTVRIVEIWKAGAKAYQWIILSPNSQEIARSKTVFSRKGNAKGSAISAIFGIRGWNRNCPLAELIEDETKR